MTKPEFKFSVEEIGLDVESSSSRLATIEPGCEGPQEGVDSFVAASAGNGSLVRLAFLRDGRLRVVDPIEVHLYREGELYLAEAPELTEFGSGATHTDALVDLQHAIAGLFHSLSTMPDRLGPGLQATYDALCSKVCHR